MKMLAPGVKRHLRGIVIGVLLLSLLPLTAVALASLNEPTEPPLALDIQGLTTAPGEPLGAPLSHFLPTPKPKPKVVVQSRPVSLTGTANNGSTNRFVSPWGCEAEHAQQWSSTGKYWGKYQFDRQTWAAHGGTNYGSANEAEQDRVASRVNYDAWPNC